jgi:hypothetical protein
MVKDEVAVYATYLAVLWDIIMTKSYRNFLKLLEQWPVDSTKVGRYVSFVVTSFMYVYLGLAKYMYVLKA